MHAVNRALLLLHTHHAYQDACWNNCGTSLSSDLPLPQTLRPPKLPPDATRLIITPETALEQGQVLGSGAFGTVYKVGKGFTLDEPDHTLDSSHLGLLDT